MRQRTISFMLVFALAMGMAVPALAAEQKQKKTYSERVEAIESQGITYGTAKFGPPETKAEKEFALECLEEAMKILGKEPASKIMGHWINANGTFHIQVGDNRGGTEVGYFSNGVLTYLTPYTGPYEHGNTRDTFKNLAIETIVHEMGHAYDMGILQYGGGRAVASINGAYGDKERSPRQYRNYAYQNEREDFAYTFAWMLTSEETIFECEIWEDYKRANLSKKDPLYKKCEAVYEILLRDFGAGSGAVKRAAKFLGKELPKE